MKKLRIHQCYRCNDDFLENDMLEDINYNWVCKNCFEYERQRDDLDWQ